MPAKTKQSESQKIPKLRFAGFSGEWEEKRLGDVASFLKGSGISKDDISKDGKNKCIRYGFVSFFFRERCQIPFSKIFKTMHKFKIIKQNNIPKYRKSLMEFYQEYYGRLYYPALKNSALVCCCVRDDKIIGAGRTISDLNRFALIVDLIVSSDKQNQGVGSKIIEMIIEEYVKLKICYIGVFPWLIDFYTKLGFTKTNNETYMEYKRSASNLK